MKLEIKTSSDIELWLFQQSKYNPTNDSQILKYMENKKWTSNKSLLQRIREDFFNPEEKLVGKSDEYIIGYFLQKVFDLEKELEEK